MNVGQAGHRKRSVLDLVFRGMRHMGRIFKASPNPQVASLRKNSKSERVIMVSKERLYDSGSPTEDLSGDSGGLEDFSRELERWKSNCRPVRGTVKLRQSIAGPKTNKMGFFEWKKVLRREHRDSVPFDALRLNIRDHFPDSLRPRIWAFLCGDFIKKRRKQLGTHYYQGLIENKLHAKVERDIEKDVLRTFTNEPEFAADSRGSLRDSLTRVLRAMVTHDPELGYVQGMNFIAAGVLFGLNPSNYSNLCFSFGQSFYPRKSDKKHELNFEKMAFWVLLYIFEELNWREVFGQNFAKLRALFGSFETKMSQSSLMSCFAGLEEVGIRFFDVFSPWFYSLMINKFPLLDSPRIVDIFLLETESGLIDLLIRLLCFSKKELVSLRDNPSKLLSFVQDDMVQFVLLSTDKLYSNQFDC